MASWFLTERGLWEDEDLQKALAVSLADAGRLKAANTVLALRRQCEGLTQFPKLGLRLSNGLRKRVLANFLLFIGLWAEERSRSSSSSQAWRIGKRR